MSNWEIVTGEDGEQYYQFEGQVVYGSQMPQQLIVPIPPDTLGPAAAYTVEQLMAMKAAMKATQPPPEPSPLERLQRQMVGLTELLTTWPNPLPETPDPPLTMGAKLWLPDDPTDKPECSEPEHGRFQNLEWEDES